MSLVIEDGTGVAGANSYATVAEARSYASARGVTLSATESVVEALLLNGADYLDSLEQRFKGTRVSSTQALAWPRKNVYLFNDTTPQDQTVIPDALKKAQCQLAVDAVDVTLQPTGTGQEVVREKVDVIEVEYAPHGSNSIVPVLNKALDILQPILKATSFRTLRV